MIIPRLHYFTPDTVRFLLHFFIRSYSAYRLAMIAGLQLVTFVNFGCEVAYATIAADNLLPLILYWVVFSNA